LFITTSFGLLIMVHSNGAYSDISINIPRHPELKGNTGGVLGRWNDDPKDDNLDANGKPQPLVAEDSTAYGNSWLIPGEKLPTQAELDAAKAQHEAHVKSFDKEHWDHLKKICEDNLHHPEMKHCLKQLGRPAPLIDNCAMDLSHIIEEKDQQAFLKAMVEKFKARCPHHKMEFKHKPRPKHIPNHKPVRCNHNRHADDDESREHHGPGPHGGHKGPDGPHGGHKGPDGPHGPGQNGGHKGPDGPHGGHSHPFLPHHRWGQPKHEHRDKCFKAKEHFKKESVKLMECLAFEGWADE